MNRVHEVINCGDEDQVLFCARISSDQANRDPKLLGFLIRNSHWSPFEMISANLQVETTRDIGRQILRHRSFSFQEFSGRYAEYADLRTDRDLRFKGSTNRQGSVPAATDTDRAVVTEFERRILDLARQASGLYRDMLAENIAAECARAVLPEGLVPTMMCMTGTARSWIHYLRERRKLDDNGMPFAQREHYNLAGHIETILRVKWPIIFAALDAIDYIDQPIK